MCHYMRSSASMYIYIINLVLADLLYLLTIPFNVTDFIQEWYCGDTAERRNGLEAQEEEPLPGQWLDKSGLSLGQESNLRKQLEATLHLKFTPR
ncbi:Urotensin-2 receptor, partial [Ophiophagus hannah]